MYRLINKCMIISSTADKYKICLKFKYPVQNAYISKAYKTYQTIAFVGVSEVTIRLHRTPPYSMLFTTTYPPVTIVILHLGSCHFLTIPLATIIRFRIREVIQDFPEYMWQRAHNSFKQLLPHIQNQVMVVLHYRELPAKDLTH